MDFCAIDVETANPDLASICQLAVVSFRDGCVFDEWMTYIDPDDYFDPCNVSIHGIDEDKVSGSPTFDGISGKLREVLDNRVAVCHTHFDRVAINRASIGWNVPAPQCTWLDSARVARRAWPELVERGYGLKSVCDSLAYQFKHHDALEDAKACGHILNSAATKCELNIDAWLRRVRQPIDSTQRDGNPEGPLYGEIMVFTGALELPRRTAADIAARLGCQVDKGVTKNTTMLVVGDQDVAKLAGHEKSSKHRKAEQLIAKGLPIRVLRETDFRELAELG